MTMSNPLDGETPLGDGLYLVDNMTMALFTNDGGEHVMHPETIRLVVAYLVFIGYDVSAQAVADWFRTKEIE